MDITEGHPAVPHLRRAQAAYRSGDADACDAHGERAARLLADEPQRWGEFAVLHVAWLAGLRDGASAARARTRCEAYLSRVAEGPHRTRLRVLRAELLAEGGLAVEAAAEAGKARFELLSAGGQLSDEDDARLLRVEGVTAGEEGDAERSARLLDRSRDLFVRAGRPDAAADIDRERERLAVRAGDADAVRAAADGDRQEQPADEYARGLALKSRCRYEEALRAMTDCAQRPELPVELRWPVLRECVLLLRALGRGEGAERLTSPLREAAACAPDPATAEAELSRLLHSDAPSDGTVMGDLQQVLRLLARDAPGRDALAEAERILLGARDRADGEHACALWHLAAGELELRRYARTRRARRSRRVRGARRTGGGAGGVGGSGRSGGGVCSGASGGYGGPGGAASSGSPGGSGDDASYRRSGSPDRSAGSGCIDGSDSHGTTDTTGSSGGYGGSGGSGRSAGSSDSASSGRTNAAAGPGRSGASGPSEGSGIPDGPGGLSTLDGSRASNTPGGLGGSASSARPGRGDGAGGPGASGRSGGPRASGVQAQLTDATVHLEQAIRHAEACGQTEVRVEALRWLGRACFQRASAQVASAQAVSPQGAAPAPGDSAERDVRRARECWNEARRVEEEIAALQVSDRVRREMALTVADETDEWIEAAIADGRSLPPGDAAATLLVAMEAAQGAAILAEIAPGDVRSVRGLPRPGDHEGARAWAEEIALRLPHSRAYGQAVWLMHAGPGHVHHAVLTWKSCFLMSVPCDRPRLHEAVDRLTGCWSSAPTLEGSLRNGGFDRRLATVTQLVGVRRVLQRLEGMAEPVRRIAVVAHGTLAEVPFGALETDDGPLGVRYALSDLPCLSALAPLRRRGLGARGFSRLVVSPRPEGTGPPARKHRRETVVEAGSPAQHVRAALRRPRRRLMLLDEHATPEALRAVLGRRRYRLVRVYSHGVHDPVDASRSRLQLVPEDDERGAVFADDLQRTDLRRCGTLVLGACESAMAQLLGAGERVGFGRAALVAGAASVVAARWVAPAHVASALLDRFESYARHEPRDVALQLAQRDVHLGLAAGEAVGPRTGGADGDRVHAANWACWTLYGDSGFQTAAGPAVRRVRGMLRELTNGRR